MGAHYDTQLECPGACDNASGVAALIEMATVFAAAAKPTSDNRACGVRRRGARVRGFHLLLRGPPRPARRHRRDGLIWMRSAGHCRGAGLNPTPRSRAGLRNRPGGRMGTRRGTRGGALSRVGLQPLYRCWRAGRVLLAVSPRQPVLPQRGRCARASGYLDRDRHRHGRRPAGETPGKRSRPRARPVSSHAAVDRSSPAIPG